MSFDSSEGRLDWVDMVTAKPASRVVCAVLFDPARNLRVEVTENYGPEGAEFRWTEGNDSCDCNRRLYMARTLGEPDPHPSPCGSTITLESLTHNGVSLL